MWHIKLLGAVSLRHNDFSQIDNGEITRFRTRKAASLLGFLVLHPEPQGREALATMLWPDVPLDQVRNNLRVSLAALRAQIEPIGVAPGSILQATRQHVSLNTAAYRSDVAEFQSLWKRAEPLSGEKRIEALQCAFQLYGGRLLASYEEEWSEPLALYLETLFVRLTEELVAWYSSHDENQRALSIAKEAALRAPHSSDFSALVQELKQDIKRGRPQRAERLPKPGLSSAQYQPLEFENSSAPAKPAEGVPAEPKGLEQQNPSSLPLYATRFWGRDIERQTLEQSLIGRVPLLLQTLVGPPAIGKTRLAIEAAREAAQKNWIVRFVSLASQNRVSSFTDALRAGLGLPATPHLSSLSQVVNQLRAWGQAAQAAQSPGVLLLLDNLEHLLPDVALEVQNLRVQVPDVVIWVTSRALLQLPGEEPLPVSGLPLPHEEDDLPTLAASPSVQLFVARARGARPAFAVSPSNASAIGSLCRHLEGWPLALELAAARSHSFTPAQMLEQLPARPDLLQRYSPRPDPILARQNSLDAAIAWSFELLSSQAQSTLLALSVFRGGAARPEIECVVQALPHEAHRFGSPLAELVGHSLVLCAEKNGVLRYDLLEGVRQFALRRLSEETKQQLAYSHALTYNGLLSDAVWKGEASLAFLEQLDTEWDNLRTALEWAQSQDLPLLRRISAALWPYWESRGLVREGCQWLRAGLKPGPGEDEALAGKGNIPNENASEAIEVQNGLARLCFVAGDFPAGMEAAKTALAWSRQKGDLKGQAQALLASGIIGLYSGQAAPAFADLDASRALFESIGDAAGEAHALIYLGFAHIFGGAFEKTYQTYSSAVAKARESQDFGRLTMALFFCGDVLGTASGRYAEALPYWEESAAIGQRTGDFIAITYAKWGMCHTAIALGQLEKAQQLWKEIDDSSRRMGHQWGQVFVLEAGAALAASRGQWERTALLLGAAEKARETIPFPLTASYYAQASTRFAPLWQELAPEQRTQLWLWGRSHTLEEALAVAGGQAVEPQNPPEEALPSPQGPPMGFPLDPTRGLPLLAESHWGAGRLALWLNDLKTARFHLEKAHTIYMEIPDLAHAREVQCWLERLDNRSVEECAA